MRPGSGTNLSNDPFLTHVSTSGQANYGTGGGGAGRPGSAGMLGMRQIRTQNQLIAEFALFPMLIFLFVTAEFTFMYHHVPAYAFFVVMLGIFIGALLHPHRIDPKFAKGMWEWVPMGMCWWAAIFGMVCGFYNYVHYTLEYFTYALNREYTMVLPTEPAASREDAGKITFSDSSRVDFTKAVGFYGMFEGRTFCAAPILDEQPPTAETEVGFWAVGYDCCGKSGSFYCDDAMDKTAKSGVVMVPETTRLENLIFGNEHFGNTRRDLFKKAARMSGATYGLAVEKEPIFVRWVKDPEVAQALALANGIIFLSIINVFYLIFVILVTILALRVKGLTRV